MKKIGILTSGGDCAGLNAAVRAATCCAVLQHGWSVLGIRRGVFGLLDGAIDVIPLTPAVCDAQWMRLGGTVLGSAGRHSLGKSPLIDEAEQRKSIIRGYKSLELEALLVIGGDGSLRIIHGLAEEGGIPLIAIPKTIDNDIMGTDMALGFQSAVTVATTALDQLASTASSHQRVMILEVMGRDAGHIALTAGVAGGADIILMPEIPYSLDIVLANIQALYDKGQRSCLIIVAESVVDAESQPKMIRIAERKPYYGGIGAYLAEAINQRTPFEARCTILGHVQRGVAPVPADRVLGALFGRRAIELIAAENFGRMVAWRHNHLTDVSLRDVVGHIQRVNLQDDLIETAKCLGISFGNTKMV